MGSLFQDPETQIVLGTPRAELAFAAENPTVGRRRRSPVRSEETALALAIEGLLDRPVQELSGGELQRVALGATLSARPALVCLDEPTSQLDPVAGDELIGLLRRLNEDGDTAVLLAEHRLERCLAAADRVVALDAGRLVFDGAPDRFLEWAVGAAPALVTPGAQLLAGLGLHPLPGVKAARAALRSRGYAGSRVDAVDGCETHSIRGSRGRRSLRDARLTGAQPSFQERLARDQGRAGDHPRRRPDSRAGRACRADGPQRRRQVTTLLRHAAGLMQPTRGKVEVAGRVALLLQNPSDYLIHETVREETDAGALAAVGLADLADRHPRDLSGGEKQRLALAIVLGDPIATAKPVVVCLDEPTRGMDRSAKDALARLLEQLGIAVVVATHDPEFVALFAQRVVLMADGRVIADGSTGEVLAGGTYFATETARILGGAGGALLPADGVALLRSSDVEVPA